MAASSFDRDFGYLIPFLDKVTAASRTAEPKARAELQTLLAGEKAKWQRIQALLGGAQASPDLAGPAATRASPPAAVAEPRRAAGTGFTVGSLRRS